MGRERSSVKEHKKPGFFSQISIDTKVLHETGLLDSEPEPVFDRLTSIAARALNVPVSLISLIDNDRQYFKSQCGLGEPLASRRETSLEYSFCQHVVVLAEPLVIENALEHPLVHNSPSVQELGVRCYLGVPVTDGRGNILGSLCAIDFKPRTWSEQDIELLTALAEQFATEIDMRLTYAEHARDLEALHRAQKDRQRAIRSIVQDLRAPLNSLRANLHLLPLLGSVNEDQKENLELAMRSIRMLDRVVGGVLDAGVREEKGGVELSCAGYFLQDLVESAVEQLALLAAEKGVSVQTDAPSSLPAVFVDGEKLVRILVNLGGKSISSMNSEGRIVVAVREERTGQQARLVLTISTHPGGSVDGSPVDDKTPSASPAGLDLVFCKNILEAHRGDVELKYQPDGRRDYTLWLPLTGWSGPVE